MATIVWVYVFYSGPPPRPLFTTSLSRDANQTLNFNFHWNDSFTREYDVQRYFLRSTRNGAIFCDDAESITPNGAFTCPGIVAGQNTTFFLRAENCEPDSGYGHGVPLQFVINPQGMLWVKSKLGIMMANCMYHDYGDCFVVVWKPKFS